MTTPTVVETRRNGNPIGERIELGRYRVPGGERIVYGQRVDGVVSFLPTDGVVLVAHQGLSEDDACRSRGIPVEPACPDAARRRRPKSVNRARLVNTGGTP